MGDPLDNRAIIGAKGVVFFGAGASQPLEKRCMAEFIDECEKSSPPRRDLFNSIITQKRDLEYLLEQLEAVASMKYFEGINYHSIGWRRGLLDPIPMLKDVPDPPPSPLPGAARELTDWIKRKVFEHYGKLILNDLSRKRFSNLFELVGAGEARTVVFTTNYDPAVEEFCRLERRHLVDGFLHDSWGHEDYWDRSAFDGSSAAQPGTIVLFKLHGSTTWVAQGRRVVKVRPVYADEKALVKNVLIYPATRKVAIEDPYFTAYDYLDRCLASAQFCVFVGYSFRDYDALMRLRAAQAWNPRLKVIVLDPAAKLIARRLDAEIGVKAIPLDFLFHVQEDIYLPRLAKVIQSHSK